METPSARVHLLLNGGYLVPMGLDQVAITVEVACMSQRLTGDELKSIRTGRRFHVFSEQVL